MILYLNAGRPIEPSDSICHIGGLPPSGLSIYAEDEYVCICHVGSASLVAMSPDMAEILADTCMTMTSMTSLQVPGQHVVRFDGAMQVDCQSSCQVDTIVMSKDFASVELKCGCIDVKFDAMEAKLFQLLIRHIIDTAFSDSHIDHQADMLVAPPVLPQAVPVEAPAAPTGTCSIQEPSA